MIRMATGRTVRSAITKGVAELKSFKHGNVSGRWGYGPRGILPGSFDLPGEAAYVVYSYDTPIAWFDAGEWTVPDVVYSRSTSRHQHTVRTAPAVARWTSYLASDEGKVWAGSLAL